MYLACKNFSCRRIGFKIYLNRSKICSMSSFFCNRSSSYLVIFTWLLYFRVSSYFSECDIRKTHCEMYWDILGFICLIWVTRKWCMMNSAKFVSHFRKSPLIIFNLKWPHNILVFIIIPFLVFIIIPFLVFIIVPFLVFIIILFLV